MLAAKKKVANPRKNPRLQFQYFDMIRRLIAESVTHFINLDESYFTDKVIYVEGSCDRSFVYIFSLLTSRFELTDVDIVGV